MGARPRPELKANPYDERPLAGPQTVAVLFDKPTLRTQASFASGIAELGGFPMIIDGSLAQVGVRESVADTARVLGRQASVIVWRTHEQSRLDEMAAHAGVPVVNALTDQFHPCQALADLLTVHEHRGSLAGQTLTFVGDAACNMAHSLLLAGTTAGMHVRVSGPDGYQPDEAVLAKAQAIAGATGGSAAFVPDPQRRPPQPTCSSPTPGSRWDASRRPQPAPRCSRPGSSTRRCWPTRPTTRSCCTACPPTAARRSPPRCSTARAASSGTRRRTAGTPRRPCSPGSSVEHVETTAESPMTQHLHGHAVIPHTKSARQQLVSTCSRPTRSGRRPSSPSCSPRTASWSRRPP